MIVKLLAACTILATCCFAYNLRRYDRLPKSTTPISYNLHIWTNVHDGGSDINGTVKIKIQVLENTDRITLHGVSFDIRTLKLVDLETDVEINGLKHVFESESEQMMVIAEQKDLTLITGKEYLLMIDYAARPCSPPHGYCLYWYISEVDKRMPLGVTKLSQGSARYVFPCYDEPSLKANFTISITHGKNYMALSNMPRQGEPILENEGYVTTTFLETPPISTHLVAFTVSNYDNVTEKVGSTDVRLFFKSNLDGGRLVLEISKKTIVLMNDYFNVSFPLPKIDHFIVPGMNSHDAENWGLIIYSNDTILHTYFHTDTALNVAIKMARMWFENLVTPAWGSQSWLSEIISTHYGIKFIHLIKPEWNLNPEYIIDFEHYKLWHSAEVCSLSCNGMEWEYNFFGKMPSNKGVFLMSMFEKLLTEQVFRKGVVKYLENHQYSSTTEDDLFDCLGDTMEESPNPYFKEKTSLKKAMKSWTTQKYHPLVTVVRNYETGTFSLKQVPYKTLEEGGGSELWWIPITFATSKSSNFDNVTADFIFPGVKEVEINPTEFGKPLTSNDWLILNKQQSGLYRVNYDDKNWDLITCALLKDPTVIPEKTRMQMIDDIYELFLEGYVEAPVLFNFLSYIQKETRERPLMAADIVLSSIFQKLRSYESEGKEYLKLFLSDVIANASEIYNVNGRENFNISDEYPILRLLHVIACDVGIEKCDNLLEFLLEKAKTPENLTSYENTSFSRNSCRIYKNARKDMKDFIEKLADLQNYKYMQLFFTCIKTKAELKQVLKEEIRTTKKSKDQISIDAMRTSKGAELFIELVQEGEPEIIRLFLNNVKSAITKAKTREHKDMLVKAWKRMGVSVDEGHYYGVNKKIKRHDKIRERTLQWLNSGPVIPKLSCQ